MSKKQPTVEELLQTPEGAKALSEVWRANAEKETDPKEKKLWLEAAESAWQICLNLEFGKRLKKLAPAARSARTGLRKARAEAQAAGADDAALKVADAAMGLLDIIAPRKKRA